MSRAHLRLSLLPRPALPHQRNVPDQEFCAAPEQVVKQLRRLYDIIHCHALLRQNRPGIHGPHCEGHADARLCDAVLGRHYPVLVTYLSPVGQMRSEWGHSMREEQSLLNLSASFALTVHAGYTA